MIHISKALKLKYPNLSEKEIVEEMNKYKKHKVTDKLYLIEPFKLESND